MKKDNLFVSFLILTEMYFKENDRIDFYAGKLGITSAELHQLIEEVSDKSFEDWLKVHYETVL